MSIFRAGGDGQFALAYPETGIEFTADRLRRERHELHCELSVACGIVGARAIDGVLSIGTFNLSSPTAAQQRARLLRELARSKDDLDWLGMIEELRQRVLRAERVGEPSVSLRTVELKPADDEQFEVLGLALPRRHATILFGDGGTGKSLLALELVKALDQAGERVGYFDWEMDPWIHRRRLAGLCGTAPLPDLRYVRCERPLIHEVDRLRRVIHTDGLTYAVLDSVGYGTAGPPESAEAAMDFARAARQLGIGTLWLAHITKGEQGDQRPFGSAFWHNSARATWFLKNASTSADGSVQQLVAFQRKDNLGRRRNPIGLELAFRDPAISFRQIDAATVAEVAASLPMHMRLRTLLRNGPATIVAMAEALNAKPDTVKKALERGKGQLFTCLTKTDDGVHRWALAERWVS